MCDQAVEDKMRVGILGHFGIGLTMLNVQTVKTSNLVEKLKKCTDIEIVKIDTHGWIKRPIRLIKSIKIAFQNCNAVVMLPAHNGIQVFSPILLHYKRKYHKKIFYDVIAR